MNSDSSQAMYGGPRNLHFIRVLALDSLTCCRGVRARVRTSSIEGRTYLVVQNLLVFFCSSHVWQRLRTDQTPKTAANPIVVSECATSGRNRANELFGNSGRNRYSCNTPCVVKALEQATSQVDVWQRNGQSHYLGEGRPDRGRMRSRTSNIRVVASKRCELNCWCNKHKPTNPTPCTQKKIMFDLLPWNPCTGACIKNHGTNMPAGQKPAGFPVSSHASERLRKDYTTKPAANLLVACESVRTLWIPWSRFGVWPFTLPPGKYPRRVANVPPPGFEMMPPPNIRHLVLRP